MKREREGERGREREGGRERERGRERDRESIILPMTVIVTLPPHVLGLDSGGSTPLFLLAEGGGVAS